MTGLPRFETVRRVRPVALVAPETRQVGTAEPGPASEWPCPRPAPYAAAVVDLAGRPSGPVTLAWVSGSSSDTTVLEAVLDRGRVALAVTVGGRTTRHRSRRYGRVRTGVAALAVTLTGTHVTAFTRSSPDAPWTAHARVDVAALDPAVDTRDERWCAGLRVRHTGEVAALRAGGFGQLGLRDLRLVTRLDGSPYAPRGRVLLTATSAGPGFFDTAHASVWELDPERLALQRLADLYFRRSASPGVFGDHAIHLVRDEAAVGGRWLVATSTWGDFSLRHNPTVGAALGRTDADLLIGEHVLDTSPLPLPTTGLGSVGVWDPHLVRHEGEWLVGYVSARRFFEFHPVVAGGPDLTRLTVRGAATDRIATEGTTLHRLDLLDREAGGPWRVLASDGRDNRRGRRGQYPVFDLDLHQVGTLDAPYPTNIPWPTIVPRPDGDLLVGFNGEAYGGALLGYGTHGSVVLARATGR